MKGKHEGNYNPYLEQRDREFMKAYRKATEKLLKERGHFSLIEALNIARCSTTTRYFVSEQRASEIIKSLECYFKAVNSCSTISIKIKDPLSSFIYQRQRMYMHLYIAYTKLREQNPDCNHDELVVMACMSPADEFYMTIQSARSIHGRIRKNMKEFGMLTSRNPDRIRRDLMKNNK